MKRRRQGSGLPTTLARRLQGAAAHAACSRKGPLEPRKNLWFRRGYQSAAGGDRIAEVRVSQYDARRALLVKTPVGHMQQGRLIHTHSGTKPVLFDDEQAAAEHLMGG